MRCNRAPLGCKWPARTQPARASTPRSSCGCLHAPLCLHISKGPATYRGPRLTGHDPGHATDGAHAAHALGMRSKGQAEVGPRVEGGRGVCVHLNSISNGAKTCERTSRGQRRLEARPGLTLPACLRGPPCDRRIRTCAPPSAPSRAAATGSASRRRPRYEAPLLPRLSPCSLFPLLLPCIPPHLLTRLASIPPHLLTFTLPLRLPLPPGLGPPGRAGRSRGRVGAPARGSQRARRLRRYGPALLRFGPRPFPAFRCSSPLRSYALPRPRP